MYKMIVTKRRANLRCSHCRQKAVQTVGPLYIPKGAEAALGGAQAPQDKERLVKIRPI